MEASLSSLADWLSVESSSGLSAVWILAAESSVSPLGSESASVLSLSLAAWCESGASSSRLSSFDA